MDDYQWWEALPEHDNNIRSYPMPKKCELTVKAGNEGIKLEVDTITMLFTEKDIHTLIHTLQDALFEYHKHKRDPIEPK